MCAINHQALIKTTPQPQAAQRTAMLLHHLKVLRIGVPAGAVDAPVGVGDAPAGAVAAPRGAVAALSGAVDERARVVRRRVAVGCVAPFGAGAGQRVASVVNGESLAGVRSVRVVGDGVSMALARVSPLPGVAADARGRGASLGGWRRL